MAVNLPITLYVFLTLFIACTLADGCLITPAWNYQNTDNWATTFPKCAAPNQSPINIVTSEALTKASKDVKWENWDKIYLDLDTYHRLEDRTVTFTSSRINDSKIVLDGQVFKLAKLVYRWGGDYLEGSEHSLDGQKFAGEGQLIFYKDGCENLEEALKVDGAVAVVAVFLKEDSSLVKDIPILEGYKYLLKMFQERDTIRKLYTDDRKDSSSEPSVGSNKCKTEDFLPKSLDGYRYVGSLTHPPCTGDVQWLVLKTPLVVSKELMDLFRVLERNGQKLQNNLRPMQEAMGRPIYAVSGELDSV